MSQPLTPHYFDAADASRRLPSHVPANKQGQLAHLNSVLAEVRGERKQAESEKLRLAERLQALMDVLPAGVLVLDGSGRVQECNPAAESLLQTPLQGRLWRELIQELFLPQSAAGDALQLRSGRLVSLSTNPLGREPGQVLLLQDITDTYQLRNRLEHFRRLADMGRMAASLAHQIRTPLSSAMLYLSRLKSPRLEDEKRDHLLGKAMGSLRGLEKLITDMLLFARGDSGQREAVRLQQLLPLLGSELESTCRQQGVALRLDLDQQSPPVMANAVLLKSALQNLAMNAIESGADRVEVVLAASGEWCEIRVQDNGPGIAPQRQEQIFEPFVSGRSEGTGLGLSVVRAVAQAVGGTVQLYSEPGQGAAFVMRIPAYRQGDTAAERGANDKLASQG